MSAVAPTEEGLHEREHELATLDAALTAALAGRGGVVLIEGAAGSGKTRLLDELCGKATGRARVLRARGGEQELGLQLLVTRELFGPLIRRAGDEELARWFAGAAELAGPLLGLGGSSDAESDFALVHGLYWLVANLADDGPVVLAVDDLHWVDETSQRWLGYLLPRLAELPVLLVVTARPRELAPASPAGLALAGHHATTELHLGTLSVPATARLLREELPDATDEFCRAAHESTGGNPLLLRRLATAASEVGMRPDADGARRLDELGPLSIGRIVLPRLHALGPDASRVATAAAVLGEGCSLGEVAALADLAEPVAAEQVDALVAKEVLRPGGALGFTHPLVRSAVHGEIPDGVRRTLHRRAASELHARGADPERVARHLGATDPVGEAWALEVLATAARAASERGSPTSAIGMLALALREPSDEVTRFGLLLDAGWQAFRSGDPRAGDWLDEALRIAPDPGSAVITWIALANWRMVLSTGDADGLVPVIPGSLDPVLHATIQGVLLNDFGFTSAHLRATVDRGLEIPPELEDAVPVWWAGRAIDEAMTGGDAAAAVAFARRSRPDQMVTQMASDSATLAWVLLTLLSAGELDDYDRITTAVIGDVARRGSILSAEWYALLATMGKLQRGRVAEAESTLFTWLEQAPEPIVPVTTPTWVAGVAQVHLERGRLDDARATFARFAMLDDDPPTDVHGAWLLTQRGRLHGLAGDHRTALRDFRAAGALLDTFGCRDSAWVVWRPGAAGCLAALGETDEAQAIAEEQLGIARRFGARPLLGLALRTLGSVVGATRGLELVDEAVGVLDGSGAEGEVTAALVDRGRLLRLARRPAEAKEPLLTALDRADRAGALLLAGAAEAELRLCGARPGRRAVTGVRSLTPAELRVAVLASDGLSNPEIAQRIFVTRKTVEKHLGAVFAKLHISSRDQLAAVLEDDGTPRTG